MTAFAFLLLMMAAQDSHPPAQNLIQAVALSGRVLTLATPPSERLAAPARLAPGLPPLLSFPLLEGKRRHRYGKLDLLVDDAGH